MATPAYALDARKEEWVGTLSGTVPWFLYAVLFASTSVIVGVIWDISWHRIHRPRHVLDAGAPRDLSRRHRRRPDVRLGRADDDFRGSADERGCGGPLLGIPRAARRVGLHLGRVRDAHLGAVRRLVAQRLRARREDRQPAAHAARGRHRRHSMRRDADGARRGRTAPRRSSAARPPVSDRRAGCCWCCSSTLSRPSTSQRWDMHQSLFYQVSARRVRVLPRERRARVGLALAGDHHRARLHGPDDGHAARAAAVPGAAAARADLRAGRSVHAAGLPAAAGRAGDWRSTVVHAARRTAATTGARRADRRRCSSPSSSPCSGRSPTS